MLESLCSTIEPLAAWLALGLLLAGLAVLAWQRPRLAGTTLMAPWYWSAGALLAVAGAELILALAGPLEPSAAAGLRFAAAMSTFCPTMALLGAKRPQDRAWQMIVLSLWGILSLPSFEWLLFGGVAEIHAARFWFLMILVTVGTLNGLLTRFWSASLLYGAGQGMLLAPLLSIGDAAPPPVVGPLAGLALLILAWLLPAAGWPKSARVERPLDRVWLDFRDAFGMVWALRIMERMNTSARMYDWPVVLGWGGFVPRGEAFGEIPPAVEESLRTLLRRFVSPEWIDERLNRRADIHQVSSQPEA